jgi:RyR domain
VSAPAELARLREQLARAVHEQHLLDTGEHTRWEDLDDERQDLNRASADRVAVELARIGCSIVPVADARPAAALTADEVELLAELEHEGWSEARVAQGWHYGPAQDDAQKLHPDLVGWLELPDDRKRIDRDHARALPVVLGRIGLKPVRAQ